MWNLILSLLSFASSAMDKLKTKPALEPIPVPVDTKKAKDLLDPKE